MGGDDERHDRNGTNRTNLSRRAVVKALGGAGALAGTGGYARLGRATQQASTTVDFAADALIADNWDALGPALHEAGLKESIEVNVISGAWESGKRQSQFQTWLSSGRKKPDLLMMDNGWTIPFIARNQVLNLSEALPSDVTKTVSDAYFESAVSTAREPGSGDLYGVPFFPDFPTMQYRKDLVTKAGYDPEGENWATNSIKWKQFGTVTKDVLDGNSDLDNGFTFQGKAYAGLACCVFNEFMSSFGGAYFGGVDNLFGPVGDRPVTVAEKPVVDSIEMVRTFIHGSNAPNTTGDYAGGIAPSAVLQWTEETSRKPFTDGNAAMHRNWPYSIKINGAEDAFGEDLGVMPIPYAVEPDAAKYEGTGGPTAALGGQNLTVNPNASDKEAALEVIAAATSDRFQLAMLKNVGLVPGKKDLLTSQEAKDTPVMGRYLDALKVAGENAIPRPVTVVWPLQRDKIAQQVNGAYSQGGNPQRAMTGLKRQLEAIEQQA